MIFRRMASPVRLPCLHRHPPTAIFRMSSKPHPHIIGDSQATLFLRQLIGTLSVSSSTALITGESGTGKELVAQALHLQGPRASGAFVPINCGAIPRDLIESELFGHRKGSFTGAVSDRLGRFELAHGGTLFLDEIGDLPMDMQVKLLRVLQERCILPVGASREVPIDVRVVAATHKKLEAEVEAGRFREDLYYRLNVVPVTLPALRARRQDIALLARHFLDRAAEDGLPRKQLDPDAIAVLEAHDWPGNVRELENMMRRVAVLARDERIDAGEVRAMLGGGPGGVMPPAPALGDTGIDAAIRARIERLAIEEPAALDDGTLYDRIIAEVERPLIEALLARHGQNQLRAARALGINRNTLRKRLDNLGIDP